MVNLFYNSQKMLSIIQIYSYYYKIRLPLYLVQLLVPGKFKYVFLFMLTLYYQLSFYDFKVKILNITLIRKKATDLSFSTQLFKNYSFLTLTNLYHLLDV